MVTILWENTQTDWSTPTKEWATFYCSRYVNQLYFKMVVFTKLFPSKK